MPWRGHRGQWCRSCDRHVSECGPLSARYKCAECGEARLILNRRELRAHSGPHFEHWRRRCIAAFGAILPTETDDPLEQED